MVSSLSVEAIGVSIRVRRLAPEVRVFGEERIGSVEKRRWLGWHPGGNSIRWDSLRAVSLSHLPRLTRGLKMDEPSGYNISHILTL